MELQRKGGAFDEASLGGPSLLEGMIDRLIQREGGFVNHPRDPGGATKYGITARTLGAWRKLGGPASPEAVRNLGAPEAKEIYRVDYIEKFSLHTLVHPGLQEYLIDTVVLHGPTKCLQWLQEAKGPSRFKDLSKLSVSESQSLMKAMLKIRLKCMGALLRNPKFSVFASGWINRWCYFLDFLSLWWVGVSGSLLLGKKLL